MTSPPDNRRLTTRILSYEFMDLLSEMARDHGGDIIALMVFTGVWTSNTSHLRNTTERYGSLHDIPPAAKGGQSPTPTCRHGSVSTGRFRTPMLRR